MCTYKGFPIVCYWHDGLQACDRELADNDYMIKFKEENVEDAFKVRDSGKRQQFSSGMVRDTQEGKIEYDRALEGPMFKRWAEHLTKGAVKYPDIVPGVANWTLAAGKEEYIRFKKSAIRHFIQAMNGDRDEDHFAAVYFNLNGMAYVQEKMNNEK